MQRPSAWCFAFAPAIAAFAAWSALAGAYTGQVVTDWVQLNGSYDGCFTNVNHWQSNKGYPADYTFKANFPAAASANDYTVTFPEGVMTNSAPYSMCVQNGGSVTFDGSGSEWVMPASDADIYPQWPVSFMHGSYMTVGLFMPANTFGNAPQRLSDFNVRFSAGSDGKSALLAFSGGTNNFYDVGGTAPSTLHYFVINPKDNQNYRTCEVLFSGGACARLPNVDIKANSATNRLTFSGGSHAICGALALAGVASTGDNMQSRPCTVFVTATNGANVEVRGNTYVGNLPATALKYYVFDVKDSTLSFGSYVQQSSSYKSKAEFRVRNGTLNMNANNNNFTVISGQEFRMSLSNSTCRVAGSMSVGPSAANSSEAVSRLFAVDSYVDWTVKADKLFRGDTEIVLVDSVLSNCCNIVLGNVVAAGLTTRMVLAGSRASSYFKEDFKMSTAATESEFIVSGGVHRVDSSVFKIGDASGSDATFTVAGGSLTLGSFNNNCRFAYGSGSTATLNLLGGTLAAPAVMGGSGTAYLVADGGTFKATAAGTVISGFSSATVEAGGLAIDTAGLAITLDQDFSGAGTITLVGGGSVTIASGRTVGCGLDVRGGTSLVFAGTPAIGGSLSLGADGTVCPVTLPYGQMLSVGGDIEASAFSVAFTGGTYGKADGTCEIFRAAGSILGDTAFKWMGAMILSGVTTGYAVDKSVGADGKSLLIEVRDPVTVTVSVAAGESMSTNAAIGMVAGDTLVFDVGAGGSFTACAAVIGGAALVKQGDGDLVLESGENAFSSADITAGRVVLRHPDALGGAVVDLSGDGIVYDFVEPGETASTFVVDKAHSNEAIRVEIANKDVTMPIYDIVNGGIVKDGRGAVSFMMPDRDVRLSVVSAAQVPGNKPGDAGFKIRQGEVAFRGRTPTIRELIYAYMGPGIGVADALEDPNPVAPKLVFDHVNFSASAAGVTFAENGANPSAGEATLLITNSASATLNWLNIGDNSGTSAGASSHVVLDSGSTLTIGYRMLLYPDGGNLDLVADNCSTAMFAAVNLRGNVGMTFKNGSCLCGVAGSGNPNGVLKLNYGVASHETSFRFESGSIMRVNYIGESQEDKTSLSSICRLVFAGGEWDPRDDNYTFGFERITGSLFVEGDGLILAPGIGQTWTFGVPVEDAADASGGLVKRGAGTVVLGAANKLYTGTTRLEGGTLDLGGTTIRSARLAGSGGRVANGTLASPVVDVPLADDIGLPVFDSSSVSLSGVGKIDFGRSEGNPVEKGVLYPFAAYTGTAPAISWRAQNTGLKSVRAVVVAQDGVLSAKLVQSGTMLIVR